MINKKTWESNFFKRDIWSLDIDKFDSLTLLPEGLITCKVPSTDTKAITKIQEFDFKYCESELIFECIIDDDIEQVDGPEIATIKSLDELISFSKSSYIFSRFRQPWFTEEERDSFYCKWIENSLIYEYEDYFIIDKSHNKQINGFVTLKVYNDTAKIGLINVKQEYRGLGIASRLIKYAKYICQKNDIKKLLVSTQLSNTQAIRTYERMEFKMIDSNLWFYKG
ncbi:GNAT family N-acetyltransferase [Shewanella sp. GXUN23E]|uniref:GNAT family N-acetyltransferase n=1 Tax=Shewanella sp. GXUN23E TaxID=3422498 RepID=UPI003D7D8E19